MLYVKKNNIYCKMSNFTELFVSAILIDVITLLSLLLSGRGGTYIRKWYIKYHVGAILMDVLSAFIGAYIALNIGSTLKEQLLAAIFIVLIHDVSFGFIVKAFQNYSPIMNLFADYAKEVGGTILIVDSLIVMGTVLGTKIFEKIENKDKVKFLGVILSYILLLLVFSFKTIKSEN